MTYETPDEIMERIKTYSKRADILLEKSYRCALGDISAMADEMREASEQLSLAVIEYFEALARVTG